MFIMIQENKEFPNFQQGEFKCGCNKCGKNGSGIDWKVVNIMQQLRYMIKTSIIITSGERCQAFNDSLIGSVKDSLHIKGKACDFYCLPYCNTKEGRLMIMRWLMDHDEVISCYCDGYYIGSDNVLKTYSAPNMGKSIHFGVV